MNPAGDSSPPEASGPAWQAYRAMLASKEEHFRALAALDGKRQRGEPVTLSETAYLSSLLAEHTRNVADFRAALAALEPGERARFVALLGQVNEGLGQRPMDGH